MTHRDRQEALAETERFGHHGVTPVGDDRSRGREIGEKARLVERATRHVALPIVSSHPVDDERYVRPGAEDVDEAAMGAARLIDQHGSVARGDEIEQLGAQDGTDDPGVAGKPCPDVWRVERAGDVKRAVRDLDPYDAAGEREAPREEGLQVAGVRT